MQYPKTQSPWKNDLRFRERGRRTESNSMHILPPRSYEMGQHLRRSEAAEC